MQIIFNRTRPRIGASIEEPSQEIIESSLNLRQVSLEDAARYGGSITKNALGAMNFRGDRKHIIVDTKVHLLMPGWVPAIPGWHTDGVPRGEEMNPAGKGDPNLAAQAYGLVSAPRYHLLVTGTHCPTKFLDAPFALDLSMEVGKDLYKVMTQQVNESLSLVAENRVPTMTTPPSTVVEWDWWNVHTAQQATGRGWRYLIRVTETDHIEPRTNPADFIRTQNQVYAPMDFGW